MLTKKQVLNALQVLRGHVKQARYQRVMLNNGIRALLEVLTPEERALVLERMREQGCRAP